MAELSISILRCQAVGLAWFPPDVSSGRSPRADRVDEQLEDTRLMEQQFSLPERAR